MTPAKKQRKGYRVVFLIAFCLSVLSEALLFLFFQAGKINALFKDDFRVVFTRSAAEKNIPAETIKKNLETLKGVESVEFISARKRLDDLRVEDMEFSQAVAVLGKNFLPDTFEVRLKEKTFGRFGAWLEDARRVEGVSAIKYKNAEVHAVVHTLFYRNFMYMCFAFFCAALALMAIMVLTYGMNGALIAESARKDAPWFVAGVFGSAAAVFLAYAAVYPIKNLSPIWTWPGPGWHSLVMFSGGLTGWLLRQWKKTH